MSVISICVQWYDRKKVEGCFRTLYTKGERLDENDTFE